MKMMNISCVQLCLFLCYFSFCFITVKSISQDKCLKRLFNEKYYRKAGNDMNLYDDILLVDQEARILPQSGLKENDVIGMLPGQPEVEFTQYGGYVTVDQDAGRAFYYYFAEADKSKSSKPLLLWLNGGPGCSSLAFGAMQERGPFRVHSDGKTLYSNPYAWNKVANVLFLESPAGVGFSYSNRTSDYKLSGDKMTAEDNYVFLLNWLERFPEYKNRDFYISGESYAGHFVPQLAHSILKHNKMAQKEHVINLKGIIIGNAVINDETDKLGRLDYLWTHALISDEDIAHVHGYCDFSLNATSQSDQCQKAIGEATYDTGDIDIYNIYAPLCFSSDVTDKPKKTSDVTDKPKKTTVMKFDPCSDYFVHAYLNTAEVQQALHANVTNLNYTWESCSDVITSWGDRPRTIIPLLKEFMANGLRVWVFSGDIDSTVPVTSTRYSLNKMKLPVKTPWYPWIIKQEVGGYTVEYKDLTFATVRGAGHQVPSYQPMRALALIKYFLDGKPLPPQIRE